MHSYETLRKEMFFVANILLTKPLKSSNINSKINTHSVVTHVLYHFCDTSLTTACDIFCSLKFHVVCTCTFFGARDNICLPTNRKMIKIASGSHIVLTYDSWHCFSVSSISVSHALEMAINFHYPTLELFCFSFTQPFTYSKFCLPNPFLFGMTGP